MIKKDFRKRFAMKRQMQPFLDAEEQALRRSKRKRYLLIGGLAFVLAGVVTFGYKLRTTKAEEVGQYISQLTPIFDKKPSPKNLTKETVMANNEFGQEIKFEFYDTLPAMQIAPPAVRPVSVVKPMSVVKPTIDKSKALNQKMADVLQPTKKKVPAATQPVLAKTLVPKKPFMASDLERDLSAAIKQKNFIVQLGLFRGEQAALRYRKVLSESGLSVKVVKVKEGKQPAYRIQQGPFMSMTHAKLAQRKLKQKGIVSLVRQG